MSYPWRVTLALIASWWLLLWPWTHLTTDTPTLVASALAGTVVLVIGAMTARRGGFLMFLMLLGAGVAALCVSVAALAGFTAVTQMPQVALEGVSYLQAGTAPVGVHPGATVIILGAVIALDRKSVV